MYRKWPLAAGLAIVVLAAAGYAWYWSSHRPVPKKVVVERPRIPPIPQEITLQGKIQAKNVVDVAAPIEGTIDRYLVDAGDQVFEGEVLAQIKNAALDASHQAAQVDVQRIQSRITELESQLGQARLEASRARSDAVRAKGEYQRAQKVFERQQMLYEAGATPRLTYEKAKQDYDDTRSASDAYDGLAQKADDHVTSLAKEIDSAKTLAEQKSKDLDSSETQLAGGEIRSPVNGLVVARRGQAGDAVDPGTKDLLQIAVDLSALEVVVDPDPKVVEQIKQGQAAMIEIAEAPSLIQGTVREVKTGRVFVDFTSPSAVIKPGLTAMVKIKLG